MVKLNYIFVLLIAVIMVAVTGCQKYEVIEPVEAAVEAQDRAAYGGGEEEDVVYTGIDKNQNRSGEDRPDDDPDTVNDDDDDEEDDEEQSLNRAN
ncbi:hypothetical protein [Sanyastnella coralliicola]|uniref:hypothetical protein n=1 Tax=Sanyastnella coralliicola TaxID=3069118 RepID=UPI0027B93ECE|nr:hypothetical protein [Longitalea sp. SCSIO 12813]